MNFDFDIPEDLSWKTFKIPKKTPGKFRTICAPNDALKKVQASILQYLYTVKTLKVAASAHGFIPYRSIQSAAKTLNPNADIIINCDVKDFFDNFPVAIVKQKLIESGISAVLVDKIMTVCTHKGRLPQGGVCSPFLTNIGMLDVDCMLAAFAHRRGYTYCRYADDITLSSTTEYGFPEGGHKTRKIFKGINKILSEKVGLKLSPKKSRIAKLHGSKARECVGVHIRKDGRGFNGRMVDRRRVRAGYHNLAKAIRAGEKITASMAATYRTLHGRLQFYDYTRSFSADPACATADPIVKQEDFETVERAFTPERR